MGFLNMSLLPRLQQWKSFGLYKGLFRTLYNIMEELYSE